jgi:5'-nucleotidase
MAKGPIDLGKARILVTNDDGINAPGLKILEKIARGLSRDVWVVAPEVEQSGAGHALTIRRPLQVRQVSVRRYAVEGTPTDCVLLAVNTLVADRRPDLVLSGINRGANLGEDVHYSGTVAWPKGVLMNVNFPNVLAHAVTGIRAVTQGRRVAGIEVVPVKDPVGRAYLWIGDFTSDESAGRNTDLEATRHGAIAVTPLHVDLTHGGALRRLAGVLGNGRGRRR